MTRKRLLGALAALCAAVSLCMPVRAAEDAPPETRGDVYVVMDADTGQVVLAKNADVRHYPASITKIMTLGLALEKAQGNLDVPLTVSYDAVHSLYGTESSHIALIEDEQVNLEDILYGVEMASANDGANVLAEYIGGSIQGGVDAMNAQVQELGLTGTHFTSPHGLQDENHYTTAYDMALITRWALTQPQFTTIFGRSETWTMEPTNKQPEQRQFSISDWMRLGGKYYREYAKGSKTGFTNEAKNTMVTYAEQDGIRLICVVLGCPQKYDKFVDACALLDYCYENFSRVEYAAPAQTLQVPVSGGGGELGSITVSPPSGTVLLHQAVSADQLQFDYELPAQYVLGAEFAPQVHITLPDTVTAQATDLGRLDLDSSGLEQLLQNSTYVVKPSFSQAQLAGPGLSLGALPVALAVLVAALAVGWIWWRRQEKRRRVREARQRLQSSGRPSPSGWDRPVSRPESGHPVRTLPRR